MSKILDRAKVLGIENAENLTDKQLEKAVKIAEDKIIADKAIIDKATSMGIETEGKSVEELEATISEAEALAVEIQMNARNTEIIAYLSEYLGVDDIDSLTKEEVIELLAKKESSYTKEIEVVAAEVQDGKTDEVFEASNGKNYIFSEDAPARFRYLGVLKTQKEWIQDDDSMNLMVAGNLSFLTLKK